MATAVGFSAAIGVSASHLLPHRSPLSEAFPGGAVDVLSWTAVLVEIAGALMLGAAAVYVLQRRGRSPVVSPAAQPPR